MSIARRARRERERTATKHMSVLGEMLRQFYVFLDSKPQPSDALVRSEFLRYEKNWKAYCKHNQLNRQASLLFNQEVALSWKSRYAKQDTKTQN